MSESENLQLLGGALIVLSLALLYCWYNKQRSYDGMKGTAYIGAGNMYGSFRATDGFAASPALLEKHSNLHIKQKMPHKKKDTVASMHELETVKQPKHHFSNKHRAKGNKTNSRWNVDGMVAASDPSDQLSEGPSADLLSSGAIGIGSYTIDNSYVSGTDDAYMSGLNAGLQVPSEVITPMKTCSVDTSECQSVSGTVLGLTEYKPEFSFTPQYGPGLGFVTI